VTIAQTFILITVIVCVAAGSMNQVLYYLMIVRINRILPRDGQRSYFIFWLSAVREHRKLYPDSKLPTYMWICTALVVILFFMVILEWTLFNHPAL
jgi:hypothetical protein